MSKEDLIDLRLSSHQDCLLLIMPAALPIAPTLAIPKLLAIAHSFQLDVEARDLNILLWHLLPEERSTWLMNFHFNKPELQSDKKNAERRLDEILEEWSLQISSSSPRWVGVSLLFEEMIPLVHQLIRRVKEKNKNIKFMIGGPGIEGVNRDYVVSGLIDEVIIKNPEIRFIETLKEDQLSLLDKTAQFPFEDILPDYSSFNKDLYSSDSAYQADSLTANYGLNNLFIKGSQGCLRECSFCNEGLLNTRYIYRSGKKIADEIIDSYKRLGIKNYFFVDSLVNGSLKSFKDMCSDLEAFCFSNHVKFGLHGYMICRNKKEFSSALFDSMKNAGFKKIFLGIETGSEKIRKQMKKGYEREDLYWFLSELNRVKINCLMLLMVGYPTETEEDFNQTIEMINDFFQRGWLGPDKIINKASFNWSTNITPGTELEQQSLMMGVQNPIGRFWSSINHVKISENEEGDYLEDNNVAVRILRYQRLHNLLSHYGIVGRETGPKIDSPMIPILIKNLMKKEDMAKVDEIYNQMMGSHQEKRFISGEIFPGVLYIQDRIDGKSYLKT